MKIRDLIPPILARALRPLRRDRIRWSGDYATWGDGSAATGGYDAPAILERVETAVRQVLAGRAAYERDGVAFPEPKASIGLLAALLLARSSCRHPMRVVDWGGSLASSWLQHRRWLDPACVRAWAVVEQEAVVSSGRTLMDDGIVSFHTSFTEAALEADLVLWGAALQYLPDPHLALAEAAASSATFLCLDRLAVTWRGRDRLTVQRVPRSIYPASYPAWFLDLAGVEGQLQTAGFSKLLDWPCDDDAGLAGTRFVGQLWRRA